MELDELKATWQALDRRLQRNAIQLQLFKDGSFKTSRRSSAAVLGTDRADPVRRADCPDAESVLVAESRCRAFVLATGLILHIYGVLTILGRLYAGQNPHHRLCRSGAGYPEATRSVRRAYRGGLVVGFPGGFYGSLSWSCLVFWESTCVKVAPTFVPLSTAIGIAGLLAMWGFHRWASSPRRGIGQRYGKA